MSSASSPSNAIPKEPPWVWSERWSPDDAWPAAERPRHEELLRKSVFLFGVVPAIATADVQWLESLWQDTSDRAARLILVVWPGCGTCPGDLKQLLNILSRRRPGIDARVFPADGVHDRPSSTLCAGNEQGVHMLVAPGDGLGLGRMSDCRVNMVFPAQVDLVEAYRQWFDALWGASVDLDETSARLPEYQPVSGTSATDALWDAYCASLRPPACIPGDGSSSSATPPKGLLEPGRSVTEQLGLPAVDPLERSFRKLYAAGDLVTINKSSRVPPLDAPLRPEWFDVSSQRAAGSISSRISFRADALGSDLAKRIDRLRTKLSDTLRELSFGLTDGTRWMPRSARPLFESKQAELVVDANKLLADLREGRGRFSAKVREDVQQMYEQFHPGKRIPTARMQAIETEINSRLERVLQGPLVPTVSYLSVGFPSVGGSQWDHALNFLAQIAECPRQLLAKGRLGQAARDRMFAMDVANDCLVAAARDGRFDDRRAGIELALVLAVRSADIDPQQGCSAIWSLVRDANDSECVALISARGSGK